MQNETNTITFNLSELVEPDTDTISGRDYGIGYSKKIDLVELVEKGNAIVFTIDDSVVRAINDSFIKGLFSKLFEKYRDVREVKKHVTIKANDYFKRLFEKNWLILQELNNV